MQFYYDNTIAEAGFDHVMAYIGGREMGDGT